MTTSEYIAVLAGLIAVWQGADVVVDYLQLREARLLWTFALPI